MNENSIEIKSVGKVYKLYPSPRARLKEVLNPFRKKYFSEFTALQDVSIDIRRGETFALLGRNGAGKSTLLKILAGVATPSSGEVLARGKIVALLELGAGFNPEMTGRDNVFLFGAFHGFDVEQMSQRYEQIVQFAEIGDFISQPVKTYSSGMFVRLAFACSVHLEPDILIVDEALSVGDAKFQQKCFKFIDGLKAKGTTIVLVSHDISLIKMVSDRACLIHHGKLLMIGSPKDVANKYFDLDISKDPVVATQSEEKKSIFVQRDEKTIEILPGVRSFGDGNGKISSISLKTTGSLPLVEGDDVLSFEINAEWDANKLAELCDSGGYEKNVILGVSVADRFGNYIFGMNTVDKNKDIAITAGAGIVTFVVSIPQLKSDDYLVNASFAIGTQSHHAHVAWYESVFILNFRSALKNVYGWLYQKYEVK